MKIVVVCWGSTGDVYPVLALSERLLEHVDIRCVYAHRHSIEIKSLRLVRNSTR